MANERENKRLFKNRKRALLDQFIVDGYTEEFTHDTFDRGRRINKRLCVLNLEHMTLTETIMSTAIVRTINNNYDGDKVDVRIIVITPYEEVFKYNPRIDLVLKPSELAYELLLNMCNHDEEKIVWCECEPKLHFNFIEGELHYVHAFRELLGFDYESDISPELYLSSDEQHQALELQKNNTDIYMIQTNGTNVNNTINPIVVKNVIRELNDYNGMTFIEVPKLKPDDLSFSNDFRGALVMASVCSGMLCCDNYLQYIGVAFKKACVVLWGSSSPQSYGYSVNKNMVRYCCPMPLCGRPKVHLKDNTNWCCPYDIKCCNHDEYNIIKAIKEEL